MSMPGFSTTAPIDIASQLSPSCGAKAEHSPPASAKQKTGHSSVSANQMLTAVRIMRMILSPYRPPVSGSPLPQIEFDGQASIAHLNPGVPPGRF